MAKQKPPTPEAQFNRGAWLAAAIAVVLLLLSPVFLAYRLTLPTDGWVVAEGDLPGFAYSIDLLGSAPGLRPGDRVIAVAGVPADWQTVQSSAMLRELWRAGRTLDYTVIRDGQEIQIPVTLVHWQVGKWLLATAQEPDRLAGLVSAFFLVALAGFVFLRRPENPASAAFLLVMALLASSTLADALPGGFSTSIDPTARQVQNIISIVSLGVLFPFALLQLALVFPRPKPIYQRYPWLAHAAGAIGLFLNVLFPTHAIGWFWFVACVLLTVLILVHNALTMRDAVSRAQLRWGLGGFLLGFGMLALMFLAGTLGLLAENAAARLLSTLAMTIMGGMLAVSILRYRLFDIDVIIRKTLVYGALTALLGLVYAGSVILLQQLFETASGQQSPLAVVLSTLLAAALFAPLRRRVQDAVDRRFFRGKVDATAALAAFATVARDETDLDALVARLAGVAHETMQPDGVSVWLKGGQKGRRSPASAEEGR